jgi:hypothetical protein
MEDIKLEDDYCLIKGCDRNMKEGSRGLCVSHRVMAGAKVKQGKTTWEELEAKGLARRKMTAKERGKRRSSNGVNRYSLLENLT